MFQPSKIQIGIKNVVKINIQKVKPSKKRTQFILNIVNHWMFSIYWKQQSEASKKDNKKIEKLKTSKDQNNEKFLIKLLFLEKNTITKPKRGNKTVTSNIIQKI